VTAESSESWPEWPVCNVDDLPDPGAQGFYVGDGEWPFRGFVVREGPDIFAYANICPHQRHPLDMLENQFLVDDGKLIRCASHGALFEPGTGRCVAGPCAGKSLMRLAVRIDKNQGVIVTAPASLRDAGPIIGQGFDTI
jgi:nitrite reductase/ring-hydroxylating ferredoxin subunit